MSKTRKVVLAALVTLLAAVGIGATASAASAAAGVQYLVPDPGMYCKWWAESQLGNAVGVTYNNLGTVGSGPQNTLKCKIIIAVNIQERGGAKWRGFSGVLPPTYQPVDFRVACYMQYGREVGVKWINANGVLITSDRADDWIRTTGWYCVGKAGKYYDQSSRTSY